MRLWPAPRDGWIAIAGVALLYLAHWFYGALISDVAMAAGILASLLVGAALLHPRLRADLARLRGLAAPGVCFGLVLLVGLWSLTPWTPGGPHPVWAYVGVQPGASTIDRSATIVELIKLLGLACFFVLGAAAGSRDERARYAVRLLLAAGVAFGLWAFIASVSGAIYQTGHRMEAHFLNPNTAGTVFAVLLVLAVGELARKLRGSGAKDVAGYLPLAAAVLTFAVCLLATASRGAMTAACGGLIGYLVLQLLTGGLRPSKAALGSLAALVAGIALLAVSGDALIDRWFRSDEDAVVRSKIWAIHWRAFLDSPLFGYGLGSAETVNKTLISASNFPYLWNIRAILNVYLQWLEEMGLVGAVAMFACVGLIVVLTLRGAFRRTRMTGLLAALLAADLVFLIHGATDFGLEVTSVAALWSWLLGLQLALAQGSSRR